MMTWAVLFILLVVSATAQSLFPSFACMGQAKAPFLLSVVLYYSLRRDTNTAMVAGLLAGFLHDALSPVPLGFSVVCFCGVGWVVSCFRPLVVSEALVTMAVFGGVSSVVVSSVMWLLLLKGGLVAIPLWMAMWKILNAGVLGIACAPIVFAVAGRLDHLLGNTRRKEEIGAFLY